MARYGGTYVGTVVAAPDGRIGCRKPDGSFLGVFLGSGWPEFHSAFGGLRAYDAGKQIYRVNGVLQMENDEQRGRRLGAH
jgi:hypothetical protein